MAIESTTPATGSLEQAQGAFPTSTTSLQQAGMDRDAFLTIFLAQLENQDPLSPQDASELGAQLATFSQLEQSIRMAEELRGVNTRLDDLIGKTGQSQKSVLDPVSMIGHSVDVALDSLSVLANGESPRLRMQVADGNADFLVIEAQSPSGDPIGAAVAARFDENGQRLKLAPGSYEFYFRDGVAQVVFPDGEITQLGFEPLSVDADGNVVVQDGAQPVQLASGDTYRFGARLTGRSASGSFSTPLQTTSTGIVDSVRMVDGLPVVTIANLDVDPSRIIRIR